jgi:hypothetical protein
VAPINGQVAVTYKRLILTAHIDGLLGLSAQPTKLHLLREEMLDRAIAYYGDTETIPANNIACLKKLGLANVKKHLQQCMK